MSEKSFNCPRIYSHIQKYSSGIIEDLQDDAEPAGDHEILPRGGALQCSAISDQTDSTQKDPPSNTAEGPPLISRVKRLSSSLVGLVYKVLRHGPGHKW